MSSWTEFEDSISAALEYFARGPNGGRYIENVLPLDDGADGAISQRPTSGDQRSLEPCSGDGDAGADPAGATAPINQPLVVMEHWSTCPHTGRRVRQEISW